MEITKSKPQDLQNKCGSCSESYDAFNYCTTHKSKEWAACSIIFHNSCDIKICDGNEFVSEALKIVYKFITKSKDNLSNIKIDNPIDAISNAYDKLNLRYFEEGVNMLNQDIFFKDWIRMVKDTLQLISYQELESKSKIITENQANDDNSNIQSRLLNNGSQCSQKKREKKLDTK